MTLWTLLLLFSPHAVCLSNMPERTLVGRNSSRRDRLTGHGLFVAFHEADLTCRSRELILQLVVFVTITFLFAGAKRSKFVYTCTSMKLDLAHSLESCFVCCCHFFAVDQRLWFECHQRNKAFAFSVGFLILAADRYVHLEFTK